MLPIDCKESAQLNTEIFKNIHKKAYAASQEMAKEYGEPEVLK
jgi:ribonucleoside-diphosphate reductase alpha chain